MKKKIATIVFFITLFLQIGYSQCCPYLDNAELKPAEPTELDSIYLITQVTTPNVGDYLGYEIEETDSVTRVIACYYSGLLTALDTHYDTINLGLRDPGTFKVEFIAWQSSDYSTCNYTQNQSTTTQAEVAAVNSTVNPKKPEVRIFPNPIIDEKLVVESSEEIQFIQMYNKLGQIVLERRFSHQPKVELATGHFPKGVYYLVVTLPQDVQVSKKLVKY